MSLTVDQIRRTTYNKAAKAKNEAQQSMLHIYQLRLRHVSISVCVCVCGIVCVGIGVGVGVEVCVWCVDCKQSRIMFMCFW